MPHTRITTGKHGKTQHGTYHIDATTLPNPYEEKWLRPRDGRDKHVQQWLTNQPGVAETLADHIQLIETTQPATISITCSAGRHRSVAMGEWVATELETAGWDVDLTHTALKTTKPKPNTTQRGYGWYHQQARERLLRSHPDGAPCPRCKKPMWRAKEKNWDGRSLAADHGPGHEQKYAADKRRNPPTRLMHATCNERDGARDRVKPTPAAKPGGFNWQTLL